MNDGSQVAALPDGASRYAMRIQLIDQAKISIRLQTYSLRGDEAGYSTADHLIAAAKRGVSVRVIVDPTANRDLETHKLFFYLQRRGIIVQGYEIFYTNFLRSNAGQQDFTGVLQDLNKRYHEKILGTDYR